jgi:predicted ATPase/DNA-binding XRE family transcriptional regulator
MAVTETDGVHSFGDWVRRRREALGLTRPSLAQDVGCSPVTIKKIERDERRPSRQIAELLADHLAIPDQDRDKFIRVARGEYIAATIFSRDLVSLPTFLRLPENAETTDDIPTLVARETELTQLDSRLGAALTGNGQLIFITGEAGTGKTHLAQVFTRRAQLEHAKLIVAHGSCNAHVGIGDPYLPFREILALLTGDVEAQWVAGAMSRSEVLRLWHLLPLAVQALVDAGPDLMDILIPGPTLIARTEMAAPAATDLLARLETVMAHHQTRQSQAHLQQSDLFAQYARVLQTIARHHPLLLVIDDLQWADVASISLLFHLARHLDSHRILVVGLYRPSDVTLGRQGERHPLEPVLNELQRQFGDRRIVLNQAQGKQFIDSFLDTEPNRLGLPFREALYRQTRGHALFTVEMLRGLQARGDLVRNEQGQWTEGVGLDWETIPARIEGVIKERIGRLSENLQEVLKIASVEGEVFTAEVVAQVLELDERKMISLLGDVLSSRHRLVEVRECKQLGSNPLSRYRFLHILFQQYLYNHLDQAQRVYLHRVVGKELERLYGEQAGSIAPQLARHFTIVGDDLRARRYLTLAGDRAAASYANPEAIVHYRRAMAIIRRSDSKPKSLTHLYTQLGRALELNSQYEQALANYQEMEKVARQRGDRRLELAASLAQVTLYATFTPVYDPDRAETLAEKAIALARQLGDQAAEAKILWLLILVYEITNRLAQAIESGERSLALARQLDLREQMAYTLNDLGSHVYLVAGTFERAIAVLQEAISVWQELDNQPMLANSLAAASLVQTFAGEYDQAVAFSDEAFQISQSIENLWGQSYSRFRLGYIYWEWGEPNQAISIMNTCIHLGELSGFTAPQAATRAVLAYVYGYLGAIQNGWNIAQIALTVAETHVPPFRLYVLAVMAQLHLWQDNLTEAEEVISQGKEDPFTNGWPLHYLPVRIVDSELALKRGDFERVIAMCDELLIDLRKMGARMYLPRVLYQQGKALLGLEQGKRGYECLQEARAEAEAIGSRPNLWPILFDLSQLEEDPIEAQALRKRSLEIVEYIAGHTPTAELRASFLSSPWVQPILGG